MWDQCNVGAIFRKFPGSKSKLSTCFVVREKWEAKVLVSMRKALAKDEVRQRVLIKWLT